jgi:dTDP-4-dehydrorhamnose reductase
MTGKHANIAVFGADGQLGMAIQDVLTGHRIHTLTYGKLDILDRQGISETLSRIKPGWVINSAALTNVDWCEENDVKAFQVNALGARYVAEACRAIDAHLIHISTDYVFDGAKGTPYTEDDVTGPLNVYGISKLAGELYVRNSHAKHYIVRTSGLYGHHPCWGKGRNFVEAMIELSKERNELSVVSDEILTPTFADDLAGQLNALIEAEPPYGVYHATNAGECSWHEFAEFIFEIAGISIEVKKITSAEWNASAARPARSVLENAALEAAGIDRMPDWKDALGRYLSRKLGH